jgi:Ca2+-dependent lipid-binding protein
MDITGKSDPYCIFHYGNEKIKSSFKTQTLSNFLFYFKDPVWNEKLVLAIGEINSLTFLKIECWDKVPFSFKIKRIL